MSEHSRIGASSYERWSRCPGSIAHLEAHPTPDSKYAAEGTQAHELAEAILRNRMAIPKSPRRLPPHTPEMYQYVVTYVDYCYDLYIATGLGGYAIEQRFNLSVDPNAFGTNDFSCWRDFDVLHIVDLKYGAGVEVEAEDNGQLLYYALGAMEANDLEFSKVVVHIVQPRIDDPIKTWEVTYSELMEFKQRLVEAIDRVNNNPVLVVGPQCSKFCNQAECPEYNRHLYSALEVPEDAMEIASPESMSIDKLVKILAFEASAKAFFKSARDIIEKKVFDGELDPADIGMKVVSKQGNRVWSKGIPYKELGLREAQVKKMVDLSPAQVEKLVKGDKEKIARIAEHTVRPDNGLSLVSASARGESVSLKVSDAMVIETTTTTTELE